MKVIIVSAVFHPEPVVSAHTSIDLAYKLESNGHIVKVITTFPNRPAGKLYEGYRRKLWAHDRTTTQYAVLRIFSFFSSQSNVFSRFLENVSFGITSGLTILFLEKPDVIYANTWPIFAQGLLMLACNLRRIPLVLSVQDLYPESLFVQKRGFKKSSWIYTLLRWLDTRIAENCSSLIVISEGFKETYLHDRGIAEKKISVIPNWIDDTQIIKGITPDDIRRKHKIPEDAFLVVYGGNIGVAAGVEQLIEAFQYLKQENSYLLLAGDGSRLQNCLELIQKHKLEHVKVHSPWQTSDTYAVLGAADLCVLPTQGEQSLVSLPSKILRYLFAGKPIIALAHPESELAKLIFLSGCGWVVAPDEPEKLANKIVQVSEMNVAERTGYGLSGHNYLLKHMTADICLPKICNILENASQVLR